MLNAIHHSSIRKKLPELIEITELSKKASQYGDVRIEGLIKNQSLEFPIISMQFGSSDKRAPCLAFIGGVHGLERIGTRLNIAFLRSLLSLLQWDEMMPKMLESCRILFYPLVNPVGMLHKQRSNGQGVDLMRNAPVEADSVSRYSLHAGHRYSPSLPWYRGALDAPMEKEAQLLSNFVEEQIMPSKFAISVDLHSGYGATDRLWFPYASSRKEFPNCHLTYALKSLLDKTYEHHIYCVEPQSQQYLAHGDLWDYLFDKHQQIHSSNVFLPLSLEMGSWLWVKKNPRQALSMLGAFNPILPHRRARILRRHMLLFDFLIRAVVSHKNWTPQDEKAKESLTKKAFELWYARN